MKRILELYFWDILNQFYPYSKSFLLSARSFQCLNVKINSHIIICVEINVESMLSSISVFKVFLSHDPLRVYKYKFIIIYG